MTWLMAGVALGLAGSLHCAGMCGPLLLAVHRGGLRAHVIRRMALYHAARVFTYALLGIPAGYAAHALSFGAAGRAVAAAAGMALVAAALVELTGNLGGTGEIVRLGRGMSYAWSAVVVRIATNAAALTRRHPLVGYVALGAVNGLLPCGLVYAAVAGAAASGTIASALTFMLGFGVGTVPLLFAVTVSAGSVPAAVRQRLRFVAPALMAAAGLLLIVRAFAPLERPGHRHHEMSAMSGANSGSGGRSSTPSGGYNLRRG